MQALLAAVLLFAVADEPLRLSLADCVALATAKNIGILQTVMDNRKTELTLKSSEYQWIPNLSASVSHGLDGDANSASVSLSVPASPFGTTVSLSASHTWQPGSATSGATLSLTQPLLEGSARFDNLMSLYTDRIAAAKSRNSLEAALQSLIYTVHSQYLACIKQELTIGVQEKALERVLELFRATKEKERLGMVTMLDVAEVENQLAARRLALRQVNKAHQAALDALKRTLDLNVETLLLLEPVVIELEQYENERERVELEVHEETGRVLRVFTRKGPQAQEEGAKQRHEEVLFEPARVDAEFVLERALADRLDLANARLELARRRLDVEVSRRTLLPDLDLSVSYGLSGSGGSSRTSFPLADDTWSVSLSLSTPLSALNEGVDLRKALLDYEKQRLEVRKLEEAIREEARTLARDLEVAAYSVLNYGLQVRTAHIGLESARVTYEMGYTGFFRVLDAEDRLLKAQKGFLQAYLDYSLLLEELAVTTARSSGLLAPLVAYGRKVEQRLLSQLDELPKPPDEIMSLLGTSRQKLDGVFVPAAAERAAPARELPAGPTAPAEPEAAAEDAAGLAGE